MKYFIIKKMEKMEIGKQEKNIVVVYQKSTALPRSDSQSQNIQKPKSEEVKIKFKRPNRQFMIDPELYQNN